MFSYLILTTRALLLEAVICGVMAGYVKLTGTRAQRRIVLAFAAAGGLLSIWIAYMRNTTNRIDTAILNGWLYAIALSAFVLFLVVTIGPLGKNRILRILSFVFLGCILSAVIGYGLPDVWAYPYHVLQQEKTMISTDFLLSMIGMLLGLILAVVTFLAAKKCTLRISALGAGILLRLVLLIYSALRVAGLYSALTQKKLIPSNHALFRYTIFVKNHSDAFMFAAFALIVAVGLVLWIKSFQQKEPYRNPAEHRKIRAKWRRTRRWATTAIIGCALAVINLTVVERINATDVTLSPVEEVSNVDDENVYVGFDLVSDGHLHRFAYETEAGVQIRFIVIQKPNSSSYGVGLDACDVCGETGYYEKDGQVVCNLCDVVMNISTIGFKGGCNPIVIPYEIMNGQIIVPVSGLLEYESEFK